MNRHALALPFKAITPCLALGLTAVLLGPSDRSHGFTKISGTLNVFSQRDWRVFNNFEDAEANDNDVMDPNFPGWLGADQAIWKGAVEWGSEAHGDGSGDPTQFQLGDGGANMDFVFAGRCINVGNQNTNIMTGTPSCGGGLFAYTIVPNSDGWKTKICEEWIWSDGPGAPPAGQIDLQGVACHEFGHALGLGHSSVSGATMVGTSTNGLTYRSIEADDIAGVQCRYNVKNVAKVRVTGVSVDLGTSMVTVTGQNFTATGNEVWLTNINATTPNEDPKVIFSGLNSTGGGTQIVFAIPPDAADGALHILADDVGGKSLSNSWPISLGNAPGGGPLDLLTINPGTVEALIPGTTQTVTLNGTGFTPLTTVSIDGVPLDPTAFTIVDGNTITLDMPLVSTLGPNTVTVQAGGQLDSETITVVSPSSLVLQCGSGDPMNGVSGDFDVSISGTPNELHFVLYSGSNVPSKFLPFACLDIGANFSDLFELGRWVVDPIAGVTTVNLPLPALTATFFLQSLTLAQGLPVADSNVQSIFVTP